MHYQESLDHNDPTVSACWCHRVVEHSAARRRAPRTYSATAGGFVDARGDPISGDAAIIASQGWVAAGTSGATSTRPVNPANGRWHVDTTLGYAIVFDGRNPIMGAAV